MKTKQLQKSKFSKAERKKLKSQEEDVPTSFSPSIQEVEKRLGHGFWGNQKSGYIYGTNN